MNRQDQIDKMAYTLMLTGKSLDTVYPDDCEKIAAVLYDEGCRIQSEWISVEERLPEPFEDVIVYDKIDFFCIDYIDSKNVWGHTWVTHWMPLPEAPKGGAEL